MLKKQSDGFYWAHCLYMKELLQYANNIFKFTVHLGFSCESGFRRNKRSIDIQAEMAKKGIVLSVLIFVYLLRQFS